MFIYWKEQCQYCINQNCGYKNDVKLFINKLSQLEKETKNVYGRLKFNCDYFCIDKKLCEDVGVRGEI